MNTIRQILAVLAVTLGAAPPVSSLARETREPAKADASRSMPLTDGEIKKVDLDNGKVTIKHGDIRNLDMPGMTMAFTARDKNLLSNVKPGDKVKFRVVDEGGRLVVTEIRPIRSVH